MFPKIFFPLSLIAVAFTAVASAYWVRYVFFVEYNFLFDVMLTVFTAPVNIAVLLFIVIPSSIRYFRTGERRALTSMLLSGSSFAIVLVETILVWTVVKLHGA